MSTPDHRVLEGDCFDALTEFPDQSVEAVVTDPPYAIGRFGQRDEAWDGRAIREVVAGIQEQDEGKDSARPMNCGAGSGRQRVDGC